MIPEQDACDERGMFEAQARIGSKFPMSADAGASLDLHREDRDRRSPRSLQSAMHVFDDFCRCAFVNAREGRVRHACGVVSGEPVSESIRDHDRDPLVSHVDGPFVAAHLFSGCIDADAAGLPTSWWEYNLHESSTGFGVRR